MGPLTKHLNRDVRKQQVTPSGENLVLCPLFLQSLNGFWSECPLQPLLLGLSIQLGMEVRTALILRLWLFVIDGVRLGVRVLPNPSYLPRNFNIRLVGLNGEAVGTNLRSNNSLCELPDHRQLVAVVPI